MTLRRKMTYQLAALVVGLLLVSSAALWGLNGLHQDYGVALEGYQRLRQVYEASSHLATAQKLLRMPHPQTLRAARDEIRAAATTFDSIPPAHGVWDAGADRAVRDRLVAIGVQFDAPIPDDPNAAGDLAEAQRDAVNNVLARVPALVAGIQRTTEQMQSSAQAKRRTTIIAVSALCGFVVLCGIAIGILQYRGVMRPLRRLGEGVRKIAAGQFQGHVEPGGGAEFASLAHDFNRMAAELDGFYHELERKVADKSRELVRSERLASVGYLAAGVAHEINNPLGIIAGHAEYLLGELHRPDHDAATPGQQEEIEKSLRIICDEAFRCKEITGKLLSLARPGEVNRRSVALVEVAEHVASIIRGLQPYRDRRLSVQVEPGADTNVNAVEAEMKQVLLNLTINALQSTAPRVGEVYIALRRDGETVEVSVSDNGRGMTPEVLERVFEPFFTDKWGRVDGAAPGTGLGLAITHAIIESHGGRITAHSQGAEKGSTFTIRLPHFSLSLRERAGVRGRDPGETPRCSISPHPNPLPKGEGTESTI